MPAQLLRFHVVLATGAGNALESDEEAVDAASAVQLAAERHYAESGAVVTLALAKVLSDDHL